MELSMFCVQEPEQVEQAERLMQEKGVDFIKKPGKRAGSSAYSVSLGEEEGVALMRELLERFPALFVYGAFISDVEGRDSSWWGSVRYATEKDKDGRHYLVCEGSSTGWA